MSQTKSKEDLKQRIQKLQDMALEMQILIDDNPDYWPAPHYNNLLDENGHYKEKYEDKWEYIDEIEKPYQKLFAETVELYGEQSQWTH